MANMSKTRDELAELFLNALKKDQIPWRAVWNTATPFNPVSGTRYSGINALLLGYYMQDRKYEDPRWLTFNQAKTNGWRIKRGAKADRVEYWFPYDPVLKKSLTWAAVARIRRDDPRRADRLKLRSRVSAVFHASLVEGIPAWHPTIRSNVEELREQRDTLLKNMELNYREQGNQAYYSPTTDCVTLPPEGSFDSPYGYLCTFLHECGHATGAEKRLNRDLSGGFGSEAYAREELRAEIASAFTSQALGLEMDEAAVEEHLKLHAGYIQSWISVLENNPEELFAAIRDANEISDYLIEKGEFPVQEQAAPRLKEPVVFRLGQLEATLENNFRYGGLTLTATGDGPLELIRDSKEMNMYRNIISEVRLEEGVTEIREKALWKLPLLQQLNLPHSLTYIGFSAMAQCPRLSHIEYTGTIEEWDGISKAPEFLPRQWANERQYAEQARQGHPFDRDSPPQRREAGLVFSSDRQTNRAQVTEQAPEEPVAETRFAVITWSADIGADEREQFANAEAARAAAQERFLSGESGCLVYNLQENRIEHIYGYIPDRALPGPGIAVTEFRLKNSVYQGHAVGPGIDEWAPVRSQGDRIYLRSGSAVRGNRMDHTFSQEEAQQYRQFEAQPHLQEAVQQIVKADIELEM